LSAQNLALRAKRSASWAASAVAFSSSVGSGFSAQGLYGCASSGMIFQPSAMASACESGEVVSPPESVQSGERFGVCFGLLCASVARGGRVVIEGSLGLGAAVTIAIRMVYRVPELVDHDSLDRGGPIHTLTPPVLGEHLRELALGGAFEDSGMRAMWSPPSLVAPQPLLP